VGAAEANHNHFAIAFRATPITIKPMPTHCTDDIDSLKNHFEAAGTSAKVSAMKG
jgi:hypothetical protein